MELTVSSHVWAVASVVIGLSAGTSSGGAPGEIASEGEGSGVVAGDSSGGDGAGDGPTARGTVDMPISGFPFDSSTVTIDEEVFSQPIALADLDMDSDLDVLASYEDGKGGSSVVWYENSRGLLMSAPSRSVAFASSTVLGLDAGDVNNDGRIDALIVTNDELLVANNTGGDPPNFTPFNVAPTISDARSGALGDIDNDGDLDAVVGLDDMSSGLRWYDNTAGDGFTPFQENQIDASGGDFRGVVLDDLNGNGYLDVCVLEMISGDVRAYLNVSGGASFDAVTVDTDAGLSASPVLADVDGDGAIDIVYAKPVTGMPGQRGGSTRVVIAFNDGDGSAYTIRDASESLGSVSALGVSDYDSDGDLDIAVAESGDPSIRWIENLGERTFSTRLALSGTADAVEALASGDLDLDGDPDLVAVSSSGVSPAPLLFVENALIHRNAAYPAGNVLAREANAITSVDAADIDGDGDLDLVSGSFFDNRVIWYENPGSIDGQWTHHVLETQITGGVTSVHAVDFDRDGDVDILASGIMSDTFDLYINEIGDNGGDPTAFSALTVSSIVIGANDVRSGDFDGDGRPDVLGVGATSNEIFVRFGDTIGVAVRGKSPERIIANDAIGVRSVAIADVDNDGDLDVLSAENGASRVRWYDNTGSGDGTTWESNSIDSGAGAPDDVIAADFDRDGDVDAAVADFGDDSLVWYENQGEGNSWNKRVIDTELGGASSLVACDVNGDGFTDLAVASRFDNTVRYYLNSRAIEPFDSTSFVEAGDSPVSTTAMGVQSVGAGDLDGDGRCDLFVGTFAGDAMVAYRNLGGQVDTSASSTTFEAPAGSAVDVFEFGVEHLGIESDGDASLSSVDVLVRDGSGALMGPATAQAIFDRFEIIETGVAKRGEPAVIGELDDPGSISGGVISIPIDPMFSADDVSPDETRMYTCRATLSGDADQVFPNGFEMSFTGAAGVRANHAQFDDGPLVEESGIDFTTGLISVTKGTDVSCPGDCNGDGQVSFGDLVDMLSEFGTAGSNPGCDADDSGVVSFGDLVAALGLFGPCEQ